MGRILFGIILLLDGLAHAVFAYRGVGAVEGSPFTRAVLTMACVAALVGFVAAGASAQARRAAS